MRNPFRRQTETSALSLRERAATLRDGLSRQAAPAERADLYDRLLVAYAEDRAARPISGRDGDETARRAANLVLNRAWALARDVVSMPPPATLEGLRTSALASAMLCEAESTTEDPTTVAAIGLTRAVLAVTGTPLPPGFVGFGDEADYKRRDRALFDPPGSLPAWAIAEIEAEDADDNVQEATPEASSDLPGAIIDGWAAWGAAQDRLRGEGTDAEVEAALAPMNRLVGAVADLPATAENIAAKALAAAWSEWVFSERHEAPRSAYPTSERCLFDIHAAITARGSQDTTLRPTPGALDFGPDAHIAELAAEFCEAYAANIKADREHMAERMSEAEWLPHYRRAAGLMERLEATEPKTLLGMALKCLGPIGAAGYNAPADRGEVQNDPWDRLGTEFQDAVLAGTLAPLPTAEWHASPVDLIAAAGLSIKTLPVPDLCAMMDAVEILSSVAAAITCQPRQMTNKRFNGAGLLIEATAFALHRANEAVAKELRGRTPANASDQANRLASLASLTIHNDDEAETAAFARELLTMVEP